MQFIYEQNLLPVIEIVGDNYKYLFKVRRLKISDIVNITDFNRLFEYKIVDINKKSAILHQQKELKISQTLKPFHIGWCKIEAKNIEKVLPSLNEMGVTKITFIECDRSQGNFKIKIDRLQKILINSNQQCGRLSIMQIDFCNSLDEFLEKYPNAKICDFGGKKIDGYFEVGVVGCEGGFSNREKSLFKETISFDTPLILRSESAVVSLASKVLL
jgi:16S rRNA (uracil1498-N3)-methyltransferase